jgi:hypothetical protein
MEVNYQKSTHSETITKKELSVRTVLNVVGVIIFFGLLLTILTVPISMNEKLEFFRDEELEMSSKKINEISIFTICVASIYFFLANIYFISGLMRKVFFITLFLIVLGSFYHIRREDSLF